MEKVCKFELVDLGIDHEQCFQGFGVAFTCYDECAYGIGDDPAEAYEDCLDIIAQQGDIDMENLERRIREIWGDAPTGPVVSEDSEECHYYIGLRWTV
jgi:hypothetical protein